MIQQLCLKYTFSTFPPLLLRLLRMSLPEEINAQRHGAQQHQTVQRAARSLKRLPLPPFADAVSFGVGTQKIVTMFLVSGKTQISLLHSLQQMLMCFGASLGLIHSKIQKKYSKIWNHSRSGAENLQMY